MKRIITIISASAIGAGLFAHSGASGVVLDRMNAMMALGSVMKSVQPALKGDVQDFKELKAQAAVMNTALVVLKQSFPEGSDQEPSEASPKIWEDSEGFQGKMTELESAIANFTMAVETEDEESAKTSLQAFAGTCKSCHQEYRVKR